MEASRERPQLEEIARRRFVLAYELAWLTPQERSRLNQLLREDRITLYIIVEGEKVRMRIPVDSLRKCGGTICVRIRYKDWVEAASDAEALRSAGYAARLDDTAGKPVLVVKLRQSDLLEILRSRRGWL